MGSNKAEGRWQYELGLLKRGESRRHRLRRPSSRLTLLFSSHSNKTSSSAVVHPVECTTPLLIISPRRIPASIPLARLGAIRSSVAARSALLLVSKHFTISTLAQRTIQAIFKLSLGYLSTLLLTQPKPRGDGQFRYLRRTPLSPILTHTATKASTSPSRSQRGVKCRTHSLTGYLPLEPVRTLPLRRNTERQGVNILARGEEASA